MKGRAPLWTAEPMGFIKNEKVILYFGKKGS
jgi:hypothetical protein